MPSVKPSDGDSADRILTTLQPADSNALGYVIDENRASFLRSLQQYLRFYGPGHVLELAQAIKARSNEFANPVGFRQLLAAKRDVMLEIAPALLGKRWQADEAELRQIKILVLRTPRRGPWFVSLCDGLTAIDTLSPDERRLAFITLLESAVKAVEQ